MTHPPHTSDTEAADAAAQAAPLLAPAPHIERRGTGAPVLLLHGWGASSQLFQATLASLGQGFDAIAPDLPGFGATPPPDAPWGVDEYAEWVIALLDTLGIARAHVVGHSNGGRIAIRLARRWPERVDKLVLTDSAGIRPPRTWRYHLRVRAFKLLRWAGRSAAVPAVLRTWAAARAAQSGSTDYQQASGVMRATLVRLVNADLRDDLPHIAAPTLLIWGERDEDTPLADGQLMERAIPDAGLVVFDGAGHFAYLEQSPRFCHIVKTFFQGDQGAPS
jgi:pimeloyl-ACP methyl ester carboxylesterase